jgi:hypothetical protein
MRRMMETQYLTGQRLKENKLKLLQAQINPHFLYNTMDLVIWTAQNRDAKEVCELVKSLSRYYRISLSRGKELIPLSQDLEHISLYAGLQNQIPRCKQRGINLATLQSRKCPSDTLAFDPRGIRQLAVQARPLDSSLAGINASMKKFASASTPRTGFLRFPF